jgi:hypothetical protein
MRIVGRVYGRVDGGRRLVHHAAVLKRLPAAVLVFTVVGAAGAASADAAFYGSSLKRAPNLTFGCEAALINDSITGAPTITPSGQRTCTYRSLGVLGRIGITSLVPATGRIKSIAVRSGRNPAPLRLTILEAAPGGQEGNCCTALKFGPTFRPRANRITRVATNMKVHNFIDTRSGIVSADVVALSAVGPGSLPLRATSSAGQFLTGQPLSSFWYPLTRVGDPRPEAYTMPGLELLFRWEFKRGAK